MSLLLGKTQSCHLACLCDIATDFDIGEAVQTLLECC